MIESIKTLNNETVLVIIDDEETAKGSLKKNPRAAVNKSEDERYGLVYRAVDCNLMNAIKRASISMQLTQHRIVGKPDAGNKAVQKLQQVMASNGAHRHR